MSETDLARRDRDLERRLAATLTRENADFDRRTRGRIAGRLGLRRRSPIRAALFVLGLLLMLALLTLIAIGSMAGMGGASPMSGPTSLGVVAAPARWV